MRTCHRLPFFMRTLLGLQVSQVRLPETINTGQRVLTLPAERPFANFPPTKSDPNPGPRLQEI